jgi:Arc/MetJ-type ribon-helix-helix transcriptional regulator
MGRKKAVDGKEKEIKVRMEKALYADVLKFMKSGKYQSMSEVVRFCLKQIIVHQKKILTMLFLLSKIIKK